jgi:hypothetical protein
MRAFPPGTACPPRLRRVVDLGAEVGDAVHAARADDQERGGVVPVVRRVLSSLTAASVTV